MRFALLLTLLSFISLPVLAMPEDSPCRKLPSYSELKTALTTARQQDNGGLNQDMWGTVVARDGEVCAVVYSGESWDAQWLASRLISAQKAYAANSLSLKSKALSTANLYSGVQPGGFLYGLQSSNPVNTSVAYGGMAPDFGTERDPLVGNTLGGINVFGGGLALYNVEGDIVGGLGVSGDTACADHNIGWRVRHALRLDYVPDGVGKDHTDNIIYDVTIGGHSRSGYGHPSCGGREEKIAKTLPAVSKFAK